MKNESNVLLKYLLLYMRPSNLDLSRLDEMINYCLESNLNKLEDELIREIHPQINVQYNSLNIAVGRQRSGKTYSIIREIIKISNVCPRTHLLVYINKEGAASDPTFESLKSLIRIPIKYVPENKAEEYIQELLKWKMLYNYIKDKSAENKIQESQIRQMFDFLKINNFDNTTLHTLIFFEDAANSKLFNKTTNYFNQLFTRLAHVQCSVFIAVQFWKSLPTEIKSNASTIFIFPRFSKEQLRYILRQGYYSSFWDFLIDQFNYLNLFSNISECIQTFV